MSDIEELLRTMATHADNVDPGSPSLIRQAGSKRRRNRRFAWASLLILAFLSATGGIVLLNRPSPPIVSPTPGPRLDQIVPLHQIGAGMAYGPGGMFGDARTMVRQSRAFAIWQQTNSTLVVAAADLQTGEQLWRHDEPQHGDWVTITGSNEVIVAVYRTSQTADRHMVALDAGSGAVLWRHPFSNTLLRLGGSIVIEDSGTVVGLDIRTGKELWNAVSGPQGRTLAEAMTSSTDGDLDPHVREADGSADHRLVILTPDGRLRFLDTDSGKVTYETQVSGVGLNLFAAVDGVALVGDRTRLRSVSSSGEKELYVARAGGEIMTANGCGAGRLCVVEHGSTQDEVSVIDLADGKPHWRVQARGVTFASEGGGHYFLSATDQIQVLDGSGKQIAVFEVPAELPMFLSLDVVLHVRGDARASVPGPTTFSISGLTGTRSIQIGSLNVVGFGCTTTETTLVCPAADGVKVWRFVN